MDIENEENWFWFMQKLELILAPQGRTMTYISDRCKGLIEAIRKVCPSAHHGFCYFHLKQNLLAKYPASCGKAFRDKIVNLFMKCAYAPTVKAFDYHMSLLVKEGGRRVKKFLAKLPVKNWANAHFEGHRYGEMCNNVAESFNAWILEQRSMSICHLVDGIRIKQMTMGASRFHEAESWVSYLCPEMEKELHKTLEVGRHWTVSMSNDLFEVQCEHSVTVSLEERSCSCRQWQLKGFPCAHALVAIQKNSGNIYDYIEDWFTSDYFRKCYSFPIYPIPNIEKGLEEVAGGLVVMPPLTKKQAGRPRTKRSRSDSDGTRQITCSRCKEVGHNRATCTGII